MQLDNCYIFFKAKAEWMPIVMTIIVPPIIVSSEHIYYAPVVQNKMIGFMKEAADMALIGPVLKEQQKIIDASIDKKLQLSKLTFNFIIYLFRK